MSFRTIYGRTHSLNGWRNVNRDGCVVANPVPHSNTAPVRRGDAATILNAWLIYYHRHIEPITSPVWGWSATNSVTSSNHLSGTALDINAPKYPFRVRTMPAHIRARVEQGLRLFEGTISWGGHWTSPIDEMHHELSPREGDAKFAAFAKKLNAGHLGIYKAAEPAPPPAPPRNAIDDEASVAAWLGKRLHDGERTCKDGVGRYADFQHGSIYWHPEVAGGRAIAVPTLVYDVWAARQWEQGFLGYPTRRHTVIAGVGDIQAFQGGTIYRRYELDGFPVRGKIGERWIDEGFETGLLGWPTSDEYDFDGGKRQDFQGGPLVWHPSGAVKIGAEADQ